MKLKRSVFGILMMMGSSLSTVSFTQTTDNFFTDSRDGKVYKFVEANGQLWMAENLAFKTETGHYWAYNNDSANVARYGYLYDISAAWNACPSGWHLPSLKEWKDLKKYYGGNKEAGNNMVSMDDNSFSALPGGTHIGDDFVHLERYAWWWTSDWYQQNTETDFFSILEAVSEKKAFWAIYLNFKNNKVRQAQHHRSNGASVRCVKDEVK